MNWDYIAGFFDGEGNIHFNKIFYKNKFSSFQILCRFYNVNREVLISIRNFIGFGKIYSHKNHRALELVLMRKSDVNCFLKHN